jgi:gluconate 2-dehydrogenase gamma chain
MPSRRSALGVLTGAATLLPVLGQNPAPAAAAKPVLSKRELDLLAELVGRIIPKTDTPGAIEAGVPAIIDSTLNGNAAKTKAWKETLAWFAANGANPESRLQLLEKISKEKGTPGSAHFERLKGETIDVYYSTQEGLKQELGWNANTFLTEFKGCTHPEHQS